MRRRLILLEVVLAVVSIAIAAPVLHWVLAPTPARAEYPTNPELTGQSYRPYSRVGTLNTSATFDVTGHPRKYASACEVVNDGSATLWIAPGITDPSLMDLTGNSNAFPVYAGEPFQVPVRRRYYSIATAVGTTTAYRFRAAY